MINELSVYYSVGKAGHVSLVSTDTKKPTDVGFNNV